jgi:predicted transcriptional regulator
MLTGVQGSVIASRPHSITAAAQLPEDFRRQIKRAMPEREFPMVFKSDSVGGVMKWTKRVVADPSAPPGNPSRWFDSDGTAASALVTASTPEAMVKLLSEDNITLLHLIVSRRPASIRELATLARRAESNLSRTLKKLYVVGIVDFKKGPGETLAPRMRARRITLELDLLGSDRSVSLERPPAR